MAVTETRSESVLIDAGVFIGALLTGDPRHAEARPLVEQARQGTLSACTTTSILSEVYGALTWEQAVPRHAPTEAAEAVRLLVVCVAGQNISSWSVAFPSVALVSSCTESISCMQITGQKVQSFPEMFFRRSRNSGSSASGSYWRRALSA